MDARRRPPTQTYGKVSDQTWDLARAAYVGGLSARVACERFGVGEANLRKKARLEGWTKRDWADARGVIDNGQPAPGAHGAPSTPTAAPGPASEEDLMTTVLRRAREALTAGRGSEATALLKAAREYVLLHQDVDRAREALIDVVPKDHTLSPGNLAFLADTVVLNHLGPLGPRHPRRGRQTPARLLGTAAPVGTGG
ncbi:hypothetical protein KOAAANKH_03346 [Brevundimonas sp. NIBR10]|uniref:hypothetical protein n=1 Tax=Brevundimonas sp. NIBR10 TaxID=3015997 RepID=UPI0022F19A4C|nr:hypothetical protein [Brevundimonas sp. NIBR10]WGM48445.1 hypothetical protein KOAAANKH_03346 [Brevundimonas sp. NIBR10]